MEFMANKKHRVIGFTGTRGMPRGSGMTPIQLRTVRRLVSEIKPKEAHHGDCVGADEQFHDLIREIRPKARIIKHPPIDSSQQAHCKADHSETPAEYLARNHAIVHASDLMIATPGQFGEQERGSGTWATMRYARKTMVPMKIVWPDGTVTTDW